MSSVEITKDTYLQWFESMLLMRRFEEKAGQLYGQQKIRGFCHLYIGQEAVLAGAMSVHAAIELCRKVLKPEGVFLAKMFHGEGFDEVLAAMKMSFQTVAVRKPAASRGESRENYLLARGVISH
jgi:pyruvate dehydrogenase E1 component alpha subunit